MPEYPTNAVRDGEDSVIPNFHYLQEQDEEQSKKEGKPVFVDREYVEVIIPGNPRERPVFQVEAKHRERWPLQYEKFKSNESQILDGGLPLKQWPQITRSLAKTLESDKIYTVEQLAQMADSNLMNMGHGMLDLKYRAQKFLEVMEDDSALQKIVDENIEQQKRIEVLEAKIEKLDARIEILSEAPSKKSKPPVGKGRKVG